VTEAYRVFVVLDREYGDRLHDLSRSGPAWIVDTPANRITAQKIWSTHPNRSHLEGVTTFKTDAKSSTEDILINELDMIDLHHGTYSADPPYIVLEVIGASISERLRTKLSQFGFNEFRQTSQGFQAVRTASEENRSA